MFCSSSPRASCERVSKRRLLPERQQWSCGRQEVLSGLWPHGSQRFPLLSHRRHLQHRQVSRNRSRFSSGIGSRFFVKNRLPVYLQIQLSEQEASHSAHRKGVAPQPRLPAPELQDLLQSGGRWERSVADLRLQHGRVHRGGPAGREDLLSRLLHKHHVPPHQGWKRLHRLWRPVRHRHQRRQGHFCFWPIEKEAG